jgi:hypothetical protein
MLALSLLTSDINVFIILGGFGITWRSTNHIEVYKFDGQRAATGADHVSSCGARQRR